MSPVPHSVSLVLELHITLLGIIRLIIVTLFSDNICSTIKTLHTKIFGVCVLLH